MPFYQAELDMFTGILRQFNLTASIMPLNEEVLVRNSVRLRGELEPTKKAGLEEIIRRTTKHNTIYHVTDDFSCHYALLRLPDFDDDMIMVIGPYINADIDIVWVEKFCQERSLDPKWISVLDSYYRDIPHLHNEKILSALLNSLGEKIWGIHRFSSEEIISGLPEICTPITELPETPIPANTVHAMERIEARYDAENRFMEMIRQGRTHRALVMLSNFSRGALESRTEPIRNIKNYSIILNTLMRKAAESGGVHPVYIDRVSSELARRIENTAFFDDFMTLWQDMARKYCLLVKNHSTQIYSQLVQRTIIRIEMDLTADLTLKANADALNVNASYLSTLFKKETGSTLTDYVNRKRIEHAVYLLNTTSLPISTVGQRCGIQDDNYFTKMFKKYTSMTPKQFRNRSKHMNT